MDAVLLTFVSWILNMELTSWVLKVKHVLCVVWTINLKSCRTTSVSVTCSVTARSLQMFSWWVLLNHCGCGGGSLILDDDITFFLHLIENCSFIRLIDHTKLYSNSQPQSRKIEEDNFSLITFFSSEHPCKKQPPFTRPRYNTGGDTK